VAGRRPREISLIQKIKIRGLFQTLHRRDALDRLIAGHAIAIAVGAVLVTNNEDDFRDYPCLQLENWAVA